VLSDREDLNQTLPHMQQLRLPHLEQLHLVVHLSRQQRSLL
jgi:hypothetical protein